MSSIGDASYHKFLTGETVDANGSPTGADLNPLLKVFQTAINDNYARIVGLNSDNVNATPITGLDGATINDQILSLWALLHNIPWSYIAGEPTTLAGYGITDASSKTHTHELHISGDAAPNSVALQDNGLPENLVITLVDVVVPGAYVKVVVDSKGRVVGSTTLAATDIPNITLAKVADAGTAAGKNVGTAAGDIPVIQADGKILGSILPAIAFSNTTVVASQAAMLALTAQIGDVAVRTDVSKSFILKTLPASTLANWIELLGGTGGTGAVSSVAGRTGAITLTAADVGLGSVTNESKATMFTNATLTGTTTGANWVGKLGGVTYTVAASEPTTPSTNDVWFDTTNRLVLVYSGTVWVTFGGGGSGTVDFAVKSKLFTATEGQTVFDISDVGSYEVGKGFANVWIGDVIQYKERGHYVETSPTIITTSSGVSAGTDVYIEWLVGVSSAVLDLGNMSAVPTTSKTVSGAITELFTSASDGKALVAAATTGKGVPTAADATYQVIADNIGLIETGTDTSDATSVAGDMRSGKTAYVNDVKVTGALPVRTTTPVTAVTTDVTLPAGIYDNPIVIKGDPDKLSVNIKNGVIIDGVAGKLEVIDTATAFGATASQIQSGREVFVNGVSVIGSMIDRGTVNFTPSAVAQTIPGGKHSGSGQVAAVVVPASKVLQGTTIAGTAGTIPAYASGSHVTTTQATSGVITSGNPNRRVYLLAPLGYFDGQTWVAIDTPNLKPEYLPIGINVLGTVGTSPSVVFLASDASAANGTTNQNVVLKRFTVSVAGSMRVQYTLANTFSNGNFVNANVWVDGVKNGGDSNTTFNPVTYNVYVNCNAGSVIEIRGWSSVQGSSNCSVYSASVRNGVSSPYNGTVDM